MRKCNTIRNGVRCPFMEDKCTFPDGICNPVVEQCEGCKNIDVYNELTYCKTYMKPEVKWLSGRCPMNTIKIVVAEDTKKLNPLKASKKAAKARAASAGNKTVTTKKKK